MVEELLFRGVLPVVVRLDSLLPPPRWAVASAQVLGRRMKSTSNLPVADERPPGLAAWRPVPTANLLSMKGSSQRQPLNMIHLVVWLLHHPGNRPIPGICPSGAPAKNRPRRCTLEGVLGPGSKLRFLGGNQQTKLRFVGAWSQLQILFHSETNSHQTEPSAGGPLRTITTRPPPGL